MQPGAFARGTDFSPSSQFLPGPFLVCSPFLLLPFFFPLAVLSVWEAICGESERPVLCRPWQQMRQTPCCWGHWNIWGCSRETRLLSLVSSWWGPTQSSLLLLLSLCLLFHSRFLLLLDFPLVQALSFGSKMTKGVSTLEAASSHSVPTRDFWQDWSVQLSTCKGWPSPWLHGPDARPQHLCK